MWRRSLTYAALLPGHLSRGAKVVVCITNFVQGIRHLVFRGLSVKNTICCGFNARLIPTSCVGQLLYRGA